MTSTLTPVLDAVTVPADEPAAAPARPSDPTVGCAVLTLAVLTVAVTNPEHPMWAAAALALASVTVGWAGRSAFDTAWAALRRGGLAAETLTAAGLLAMLVAPVATALHGPIDLIPAVAAAAAATLHCAGEAIAARIERAPGVRETVDTHADGADGAGPVERAHRGAIALERAADRATRGVVAFVVVLAVAALAFWLGNGTSAATAVGIAGAVLLVACPRSVGRTAAAALVAGTARAARLGAVVDGPRTVEALARVDTVVLCRTGTVTIGVRALGRVYVTDGVDADEALHIAGAVASAGRDAGGTAGRHAVAAVVADAAQERFGELPGVAEFDGYPGLGMRGIVSELRAEPDGEPRVIAHAALVGRVSLLAGHGIDLPAELADAVTTVQAAGATAVAVSWDGVARAVLEVVDPVRPGAPEAVRTLRRLGLLPVLLTGDDAGAARGLAASLGVEEVVAEVAATDRGSAVARLRAAGCTVAVVGGPADEAALNEAEVALVYRGAAEIDGGARETTSCPAGCGPSVGGARSSEVALRDDDPLTAVDALRTARRTVRTVERTISGAAAYHLVALPVAAAGLLHPLAAAAAAAACPVVALLHAAALRRIPPRPDAI
ncbi:MAG TPA: HAD family hydrolase [Pseudonocardia sp.]|nr:HAD family hydrolase [Pseudonocardia sp.]